MMADVRLVEVKEDILSGNKALANDIRDLLRKNNIFMVNLMASPGAGKTSLLLRTIGELKDAFRIGVIEGDIASAVDAEKVAREGVPAVQLRTGGFCHLDAPMIGMALQEMDLPNLDCIIIENVGNLVCPAEFDTGAARKVMILSVPEGDDKPLKYPLMFSITDALIVNKVDYLSDSDFDMAALEARVRHLNPGGKIFKVSCRTGEGISSWADWLRGEIEAYQAVTALDDKQK